MQKFANDHDHEVAIRLAELKSLNFHKHIHLLEENLRGRGSSQVPTGTHVVPPAAEYSSYLNIFTMASSVRPHVPDFAH